MQPISYGMHNIDEIAKKIRGLVGQYPIITFTGSLGAGKTTLIGRILAHYGVQEPVTSPTFTYLQQYTTADGKIVYHFDLYRIDSVDAFLAAGFDEYLHQPGSIVFIEWPEVIMPLIADSVCHINLEYCDEGSRLLRYNEVPARKKADSFVKKS